VQGRTLAIGTRGSRLALVQAEWVAASLRRAVPGLEVTLRTISTEGDRVQSPLPGALPSWGQGVFARDIEAALLAGEIDCAVHSLKDLTADLPRGLAIAAVPAREDPSDVLVTPDGRALDDLPPGARVGTSSLRRAAFLRAYRPDLRPVPLRGNVDTRWRKLLDPAQGYDAIVLAAAGLARLGLHEAPRWTIPHEVLLPAPGQGALAVELRADDGAMLGLLAAVNDAPTAAAVRAERRALRDLEGGCRLPVSALGTPLPDGGLRLRGAVAAPDGSRAIRAEVTGSQEAAEALGALLAQRLRQDGAAELLGRSSAGEMVGMPW
jgi:hydroxymethylbilane synthase